MSLWCIVDETNYIIVQNEAIGFYQIVSNSDNEKLESGVKWVKNINKKEKVITSSVCGPTLVYWCGEEKYKEMH